MKTIQYLLDLYPCLMIYDVDLTRSQCAIAADLRRDCCGRVATKAARAGGGGGGGGAGGVQEDISASKSGKEEGRPIGQAGPDRQSTEASKLLCNLWGQPGIWPSAGPLLAPLLAHCWTSAGPLLALCWPSAGPPLALCWPLAGPLLALGWPSAGLPLRRPHDMYNSFWRDMSFCS